MLHEHGEVADIPQVPVNDSEYAKFCYLIKVMDAIDRTHYLSKEYAKELRFNEGVQAFMKFDWRPVVQYVQPQLQVVFLQDKFRNPAEQNFMEFPFAAIVVRTAYVVELEKVFELSLEVNDSHQGVTEVANAFRSLEASVKTLEGTRLQNGEKLLNQLRRVLKLEL